MHQAYAAQNYVRVLGKYDKNLLKIYQKKELDSWGLLFLELSKSETTCRAMDINDYWYYFIMTRIMMITQLIKYSN